MKPSPPEPREGAACEAVARLIGDGRARSPGLDLRQWAAIEASLPARRRTRSITRWGVRLAGPALAAGAAAAWLLLRAAPAPLTYVAEGFEISSGGVVTTAADQGGRIVFSDGSTIALDGDTRGRIVVPDRPSRAQFVLVSGAADLDVVHRRDTRWAVEAGPFRVDVKGTQFSVLWSPGQRHFRLKMRHGEVVVASRGGGPTRMALRSGDILDVADGQVSVQRSQAAASGASPPVTVAARAGNPAVPDPGSPGRPPRQPAAATRPAAPLEFAAAADSPTPLGPAPPAELHAALGNHDDLTRRDNGDRPSGTTGVRGAATGSAVALGLSETAAAPPGRRGSPVYIGSDGNLGGPMTGYAWVAGGAETTIVTPPSCDARGCFKDTKGLLCTRGDIPALRCSGQGTAQFSCNWPSNWGSTIGMHTTSARGPWQATAPSSIAIAYQNHGDAGTYRLTAHVAGNPDGKVYCIDAYTSGHSVLAPMLRTDCWTTGGEVLDSYREVDKVALQLTSTESSQRFDYCITAIAVNGTAGGDSAGGGHDALRGGHVSFGPYGRLGGGMTGYAWVAGGAGTVFENPRSCDQAGCFHNPPGRLCAQGSIPALLCTGQGTPPIACDWQTNWGAMLGLNATLARDAWGATAPATLAFTFSGRPAVYRLMAHRAGAPDNQTFCVDDYHSGQIVDATAFKSQCWSDSGETLSSYEDIDKMALQIMSADDPVHFDVCISDVVVR